jgi:hypothetical protein
MKISFYWYPMFCIALGIDLEVQWHTYFSIQFQTILAIHQSLYHDVPTHSSHVHITVPQVPIFTSGHLSWGWARASHVDRSQMTSFVGDGDYGMLGHSFDYVMLMWYIWITWWCLPEFYFLRWASLSGLSQKHSDTFLTPQLKNVHSNCINT